MSSPQGNSQLPVSVPPTPAQRLAMETALVHALISSIPDENAYVGKQMLLKLLQTRGPEGVAAFATKVRAAAEQKQTPKLDMLEKETLRSISLNVMDRRVFMDCLRWGALGSIFTITSGFSLGEQLYRLFSDEPSPQDNRKPTPFTHTRNWLEKYVAAPLGFVMGANWVYDAYAKWQTMKLDHVAVAVTRMYHVGQALQQHQRD